MNTVRSGNGWRTTIADPSGAVVSIWAHTERDAEYMAAREHMEQMRAAEREEQRLVAEFTARQMREHEKVRARA